MLLLERIDMLDLGIGEGLDFVVNSRRSVALTHLAGVGFCVE